MESDPAGCKLCEHQHAPEVVRLWDGEDYCRHCIVRKTGNDDLFFYAQTHPVFQETIPLQFVSRTKLGRNVFLMCAVFFLTVVGVMKLSGADGEVLLAFTVLFWPVPLLLSLGFITLSFAFWPEGIYPREMTLSEGVFTRGEDQCNLDQIYARKFRRIRWYDLLPLTFPHAVIVCYCPEFETPNLCVLGTTEELASVLDDFFSLISFPPQSTGQKASEG